MEEKYIPEQLKIFQNTDLCHFCGHEVTQHILFKSMRLENKLYQHTVKCYEYECLCSAGFEVKSYVANLTIEPSLTIKPMNISSLSV